MGEIRAETIRGPEGEADAREPWMPLPRERRSDRRLLRAARAGSVEAVEELIERHWARAHQIAFGVLGDPHAAEDVTQEAMLSMVGSIGRLDPYRPFEPWLHRVVTNRALDWAKACSRRRDRPAGSTPPHLALVGGEPGGPPPAPSSALLGGADPELERALAGLSPEHRAVVMLRFAAGYSPAEIGKLLGIPRGTVGSRLRRALDQLRQEMEETDG